MARLMLLNECYPDDLSSGRDLRVNRFCAELASQHDCYFVSLSRPGGRLAAENTPIKFCDTIEIDDFRGLRKSVSRHFRTSNSSYMQRAWPRQAMLALQRVRRLQRDWNIDAIVNFTASLSALVLPIPVPKLLDRTDCDTLMLERRLANRGREMRLRERVSTEIELLRERRRERALVSGYDRLTTISEPDQQRFMEVGRCAADKITIVQNGVSELALQGGAARKAPTRSVVFWGNLDFPPNWTAVNHFYRNIFEPYLADKGIEFFIVGRGGERHLVDMSGDDAVKRLGFVPDLFPYLADKGVMINPMVEGGGLKNKVLEAFAMRLPVVSTSLGVDAIPVENGVHVSIADDAGSFAASILAYLDDSQHAAAVTESARRFVEDNYDWRRLRNQFAEVVAGFLNDHDYVPGQRVASAGAGQ